MLFETEKKNFRDFVNILRKDSKHIGKRVCRFQRYAIKDKVIHSITHEILKPLYSTDIIQNISNSILWWQNNELTLIVNNDHTIFGWLIKSHGKYAHIYYKKRNAWVIMCTVWVVVVFGA